ncbi:hypothetical protein ACOSP7_023348 [Xanthoceras sorbifolium]
MSHRKVYSQGSIPFSWEDKPGVSRINHQECPSDTRIHALNLVSSAKPSPDHFQVQERKIPLPPCPSQPCTTQRSASSKGLTGWWQEDPFLVAYKECTKNTRNVKLTSSTECKRSTTVGSKTRKKKSKFIFSCKNSCDVKDDNLVMLPNLPPLPKERIRRFR